MGKKAKVAVTAKGELKRLAILKVARQCFETFGYAKTTIEDITRACDITKSSLFYYYESKENLFYHSFTKVWEEKLVELLAEAQDESPIETRIQDYIEASARYYQAVVRQFGTSSTVLLQNETQFEEVLKPKVHKKINDFYQATIEAGIEAGIFSDVDASRLAEAIGRIERTFRFDAFRVAEQKGKPRVNFKALAADTRFVIDRMLLDKG